MKKISVVIPRYNKGEDVGPMAETSVGLFRYEPAAYDYELIFIDNDPRGRTRGYLRTLCAENRKIRAIFNTKNSGQFNSPYYRVLRSAGDATVLTAADLQNPLEITVRYITVQEKSYKITIDVKAYSMENPLMCHLCSLCYKWIRELSETDQIEHFMGFGLYDKSFIQVLRDLDDPTPFLRGTVAEFGCHRKEIPYDQPKRRAGKAGNNLHKLYDTAMLSVTSYTKSGLRFATFLGGIALVVSIAITLIYLVMKLLYWDRFRVGLAPLLIDMSFLDAVQIFFTDMVDEYVLTINQRVTKRPLVVEAERLNFESEDAEET